LLAAKKKIEMAELVPPHAICLLYRRYMKSAIRVPNTTIRMLLVQQIKNGFRRNQTIRSALAQRELIAQAHKDLGILEDERHQRTLYINRFGVVSCLEWEVRRTEWHISPRGTHAYIALFIAATFLALHILTHTKVADDASPEIAKSVEQMALRLECDNPEDLWSQREARMAKSIESIQNQRTLEHRILATFKDAPAPLPHLQNPSGSIRVETALRQRQQMGQPIAA
jgi:hypothetical protein